MSVWIHKGEESELICPSRLQSHLSDGWSVVKGGNAPSKDEADTNNSGKLSVSEVRAAAKKAGIKGYNTKKLNKLKAELGYVESTGE